MGILKAGWAGALLALISCSTQDLGTGMNTVDRDYQNSVKQTHEASLATVQSENLKVEKNKWDDLGGEIVAQRADSPDDKVLINIEAVNSTTTRVKVRVQPGNKEQAQILQNKIAEKLFPAAK